MCQKCVLYTRALDQKLSEDLDPLTKRGRVRVAQPRPKHTELRTHVWQNGRGIFTIPFLFSSLGMVPGKSSWRSNWLSAFSRQDVLDVPACKGRALGPPGCQRVFCAPEAWGRVLSPLRSCLPFFSQCTALTIFPGQRICFVIIPSVGPCSCRARFLVPVGLAGPRVHPLGS